MSEAAVTKTTQSLLGFRSQSAKQFKQNWTPKHLKYILIIRHCQIKYIAMLIKKLYPRAPANIT